MSRVEASFPVLDRPEVEVSIPSGNIEVAEGRGETIDVVASGRDRDLEDLEIEQLGSRVMVRLRSSGRRSFSRRIDVSVTMPPGGHGILKTAAGDVVVGAPMASVDVKVGAGDVRLSHVAGLAQVKSASGDVRIDSAGDAQVGVASGDIRITEVEKDVAAKTASGDIDIGSFGGDATLKSAAGDLTIGRVDGDSARATTMSGTVKFGLPPRLSLDVNLRAFSGSIRNELPEPAGNKVERHVELSAKTLSGDVILCASAEHSST